MDTNFWGCRKLLSIIQRQHIKAKAELVDGRLRHAGMVLQDRCQEALQGSGFADA